MKILHILSNDDKYGSAKSFLELLDKECSNSDFEPYVVSPENNRILDICKEKGIKNIYIHYEGFQVFRRDNIVLFSIKFIYHQFRYYYYNRKALKELLRIIKSEKIDLIHTNTSVINVGAELSKRTGIPHVWHVREFGREDYNTYSLIPFMTYYMNSNSDKFICITETVKDAWIKKGLDANKITVVTHGVNSSGFSLHKRDIKNGLIKIVMCGSYTEAKGQKHLINAISLLDSSEKEKLIIYFYGKEEGEYFEQLYSMVQEKKLQQIVQFCGYCDNIPNVIGEYDVGIVCSRGEAMGRVTIEYMMSGVCVVASACGANMELLDEGECGLLYNYDDDISLADTLKKLIKNPQLITMYAGKGYLKAMGKYDFNNNVDSIFSVFEETCKD